MTKAVLAVDFDDVIAGFNRAFVQYHNEHFGTAISYEGIYTYDMATLYDTDNQTIHQRVMEFCHQHHDRIEPIEGAIESLCKLKKRYQLQIVTSRCESIEAVTRRWNYRLIDKLFSDAHFTNGFASKYPERKRSKLEVCDMIRAVALIDDAVSHANEVAAGAGIAVFLPTRPWNKDAELWDGVTRVDGWEEITAQLLS